MAKTKRKASPSIFDPIKAKRYAERVKALMVERKALNEDISEVCAEAKDDGLEPTFIRFAAQESLKDEGERSERDEKRALYIGALGLAVHAVQSGEMSARQAARVYKIGKSSVYKELSVREVSALASDATGHDAKGNPLQGDADGVIVETENEQPPATVPGGEAADVAIDARAASGSPTCGGGETAPTTSPAQGPVVSEPFECTDVAGRASGTSHAQGNRPAGVAPGPQDLSQSNVAAASLRSDTHDQAVVGNEGGDHVTASADTNPNESVTIESPAGGEKPVPLAGERHDERRLIAEPEVARAVPPATDPAERDSSVEFVREWQAAIQGDQRGREPAPPEVNSTNDLGPQKGDQPATPAAAADDDLAFPDFLDARKRRAEQVPA